MMLQAGGNLFILKCWHYWWK